MSFLLRWMIRFLFFQIPGTRFAAGMLVLLIAVDFVLYLGMALGLYRMAQRLRIRGAFLAWIPVVQVYVVGAIADDVRHRVFYRMILCSLAAASIALMVCAYVFAATSAAFGWSAFAAMVVLAVFSFRALYRIYALYAKTPTALLVLSVVFFFLIPVFLFALRNRTPQPVTARRHLN